MDSTGRDTTISREMTWAGVPSLYVDVEPRPDLLEGAYITGPSGVGKTYAACGAIRAFVEQRVREVMGEWYYYGKHARFVDAPTWFQHMRSTYDHKGMSEQEVFDRYSTCALLVLDDLGRGSRTDWATERIYTLVNHRSANGLPTIITSNYDLGELASMLSADRKGMEAIASRIAGMCKGVKMNGDDRRLKKS